MNKRILGTLLVSGSLLLASCNSGGLRRNPGKIYAPDMTYSQAYDPYTENPIFANGLTSQPPVPGTIARGHALPNHLTANDTVAYYALQSPYKFTEMEMTEGKRLYDIHCGVCHGAKLNGNGPLYNDGNGPYAAAPANLQNGPAYITMSIGKMYYAIMYGKNMMGSYASQLNEKQRWQVLAYIKKVQSENGGAAFTLAADPGATSATRNTDTVAAAMPVTPSADTAGTGATATPANTQGTTN